MEPVVGPYMLSRDSDPYYNVEEKPWMRSLMKRSDLQRVQRIVRDATGAALRDEVASDTVMKNRVTSLCVTVTGPPLVIWLWNSGITEPDEPSTLPKRTIAKRVTSERFARSWATSAMASNEPAISGPPVPLRAAIASG